LASASRTFAATACRLVPGKLDSETDGVFTVADFITIIEKPNNTHKPYTVRWRFDGRQSEKSFTTKKQAEDFEIELAYRRSRGTYIDPRVTGQTFKEAAEIWLTSEPRSPNTLNKYRSVLANHINPVFGNVAMDKFARDVISVRTFLNETLPANGLSAFTISTWKMVMTGT
jgi:hypothetical protein